MNLAVDQPSTKVPVSVKFAYGAGGAANGIKEAVFNSFLLFYYTAVLGLSGSSAGTALLLAMCVDAVSDPLVGYASDHTRTRWGRRHPYMYAAGVPMAACMYLLMSPPEGLGELGLFAWLTAFCIGVRFCLTLIMIPRSALVPEITTDYDERTSLVGWGFLIGWMGALLIGQIAWWSIFPGFEVGRMAPQAYAQIGTVAAIAILIVTYTCALGTHSLIPTLRQPTPEPVSFGAFIAELRNALSNRSLRMIIFGAIIVSAAANFQEVFSLYMGTYFWEFEDSHLGGIALIAGVGMIIGVAVARPLSQRSDKRRVAIRLATFLLAWGPLSVTARLLGIAPENGSPLLFPFVAGHLGIAVVPVVAMGILFSSMVKDTIDENELVTGLRQEGVFVSALAFVSKAIAGVGNFLGGVALEWIDFPQQAAPGSVAPEKIFWLGVLAGPGLMVLYTAGVWFLTRYEITRERYEEVRRALDARRMSQGA